MSKLLSVGPLCYSLTICRNVSAALTELWSGGAERSSSGTFSFIFHSLKGGVTFSTASKKDMALWLWIAHTFMNTISMQCSDSRQLCTFSTSFQTQNTFLRGNSFTTQTCADHFPSNNFLSLRTKLAYLCVQSVSVYTVGKQLCDCRDTTLKIRLACLHSQKREKWCHGNEI